MINNLPIDGGIGSSICGALLTFLPVFLPCFYMCLTFLSVDKSTVYLMDPPGSSRICFETWKLGSFGSVFLAISPQLSRVPPHLLPWTPLQPSQPDWPSKSSMNHSQTASHRLVAAMTRRRGCWHRVWRRLLLHSPARVFQRKPVAPA